VIEVKVIGVVIEVVIGVEMEVAGYHIISTNAQDTSRFLTVC
jgi:hypothetical protein